MTRATVAVAVLCLVLQLPLPRPAGSATPVVFDDVSLVDTDSGAVRIHQAVVVTDGRISYSGPQAKAPLVPGATRIDGRGRFMLPGLADMHVHMSREDIPLFLANGVTTVREMNGSPDHLALRQEVAQGRTLGPTLYVASTMMSGIAQRYRHVLLANPEDATAAVRAAAEAGYDFIKAYSGLSADTYRALVVEARSRDIPVVGHIARDVGLDAMLASGSRSIEHAEQFGDLAGHPPDTAAIGPMVATLARFPGTWVEPTLAVIKFLSMPTTAWADSLFGRPATSYEDQGTLAWWRSRRTGGVPDSATQARQQRYFGWMRRFVTELRRSRIRILAGTDTPNPGMVPGFSLVDELEVLREAGYSGAELLRIATHDAAEFVGGLEEFGTLRAGARADLVLLDADLTLDLEVLRRPSGVMVRGTWLDRAALDELLIRHKH